MWTSCPAIRSYPYQRPFARRIIESLIINDGATLTALFSRQCLDGDMVVFRQDGSAVRMRDHADSFSTGVKPTRRYKIRGGAEVVMTDNHPVSTPDGWTAAGLLRPGDTVSVLTDLPRWAGETVLSRDIAVGRHRTPRHVEQPVSEALGRFLGYLTTDGSLRPGQSVKFTSVNPLYLSEVADLSEKLFGVVPGPYPKGNGADLLFTTTKSSFDNRLLDVMHALRWDHKFPVDVFSWSPDVVAEFVNRAWSGDGCITMKRSGPEVFLACGNDEVYARYWQALLHKFGVMSAVKREHMAKGTGTFHRLVVGCGALNLRRFFASFGLIYGKESQSVAAIDFFVARALRKPARGARERVRYLEHGVGPDEEHLAWGTVVAIEDAGEREVFDMHVEGKGWFIAQGVQVSNSGKSETVSNVVAACMIMFPKLAVIFPELMGKFKEGLWVGAFAPVSDQAENLYGRIVARLTSERAQEFMADPEIDDSVQGGARYVKLRSGSLVRMQTAHPRATIEGRTYHLIVVDEAQGSNEKMVDKSIAPMGASTNATMVFTGTPSYEKGVFLQDDPEEQAGRDPPRCPPGSFRGRLEDSGAGEPELRPVRQEGTAPYRRGLRRIQIVLPTAVAARSGDVHHLRTPRRAGRQVDADRALLVPQPLRGGYRPGPQAGLHHRHGGLDRLGPPGRERVTTTTAS